MVRDKIHMEQTERWAEFVRTNERKKWKEAVNILVNETYKKADEFYWRLEQTEKGREILKRLKKERMRVKNLDRLHQAKKKGEQQTLF